MALVLFLIQVFIISFSGAVQPGPVTATAITMGARNRWAGVLLAVGHGIIEFPLMVLIILGLGASSKKPRRKSSSAPPAALSCYIWLIVCSKPRHHTAVIQAASRKDKPIIAGIVLTASNPYFLIWWATVGLVLATDATKFGLYAFALFAVVHWFVDLIWVTALSFASFHGSTLLGPKLQTIVLRICAAAMLFFGLFFLYSAASTLRQTL